MVAVVSWTWNLLVLVVAVVCWTRDLFVLGVDVLELYSNHLGIRIGFLVLGVAKLHGGVEHVLGAASGFSVVLYFWGQAVN